MLIFFFFLIRYFEIGHSVNELLSKGSLLNHFSIFNNACFNDFRPSLNICSLGVSHC